jgi:hypothetical protein
VPRDQRDSGASASPLFANARHIARRPSRVAIDQLFMPLHTLGADPSVQFNFCLDLLHPRYFIFYTLIGRRFQMPAATAAARSFSCFSFAGVILMLKWTFPFNTNRERLLAGELSLV